MLGVRVPQLAGLKHGTPIFNKIGTIAETRTSLKRLVIFEKIIRHVVARVKGYKEKYWSLGTNRGY